MAESNGSGTHEKKCRHRPFRIILFLLSLPYPQLSAGRSLDVEGAYLLADQDDFVEVKFTGESVDVLCQVDAGYEEFVTYENGRKVLYLELLKALYGCLRSALLWYELYSTKLKGMGFTLNP